MATGAIAVVGQQLALNRVFGFLNRIGGSKNPATTKFRRTPGAIGELEGEPESELLSQ
jgi:hypothetical protein